MKINKKKVKMYALLILGVAVVMLSFMPYTFADSGDFVAKQFAKLIRAIGNDISDFLSKAGCGIDKLIFNQESKDLGLTLLSEGALSKYIYKVYINMQYIGAAFMIPFGIWITLDFIKFSNDGMHKSILIGRLKNFVIGILLLMSMPLFLQIVIKINYALVSIFKELGLNEFNKNLDIKSGLLMDMFKKTVADDKTLTVLGATVFTISSFLNVYFVILYFIRDLTITFLFILFPIIVMNFAYKKENTIRWAKEMIANIMTQSVHAMILSVVLGIFSNVAGKDKTPSTYEQLFCLTAFASIIPITAYIKELLGIDAKMGAANGHAVAGMVVGGTTLAKDSINNLRRKSDSIRRQSSDSQSPKKEDMYGKSGSREYGDISNTQKESISQNTGADKKNKSKGNVAGGIAGLAVSSYGGLAGTIGGLALGGSEAVQLAENARSIGSDAVEIGAPIVGSAYGAISKGARKISNMRNKRRVRPELKALTAPNYGQQWNEDYSKAKNMIKTAPYNYDGYGDSGQTQIIALGDGNSTSSYENLENLDLGNEEINIPINNIQGANIGVRTNIDTSLGGNNSNNNNSAEYKSAIDSMIHSQLSHTSNDSAINGIKNINIKANLGSYASEKRFEIDEEAIRLNINNELRVIKEDLQTQKRQFENQIFVDPELLVCE